MFRRKDENSAEFSMEEPTLSSAPAQSQPSLSSNTAPQSPAASAAAPLAAAPSAPVAPAAQSPYAPMNTAARPVATANGSSEAPRSSAPAQGSYRSAPVSDLSRSVGAAARPASASSEAPRSSAPAPLSDRLTPGKSNRRVLTVGNDILLKGEIATCDRLVIEGRVEAKLSEVHTVEIAECGSFKGTAEVEDAEISGVFEGDLVVRNRIVIYATGEVRGNISYGEIEIERGGRLTGQIKTVVATATAGKSKAMDVFQDAAKGRTTKEAPAAAA